MADEFILDPARALQFQSAFRNSGKSDIYFDLLCQPHTLGIALEALDVTVRTLQVTVEEAFQEARCVSVGGTPHSIARLRTFFRAHPDIQTLYDMSLLNERFLLSEPKFGKAVVELVIGIMAFYNLRLSTP